MANFANLILYGVWDVQKKSFRKLDNGYYYCSRQFATEIVERLGESDFKVREFFWEGIVL